MIYQLPRCPYGHGRLNVDGTCDDCDFKLLASNEGTRTNERDGDDAG